MLVSIFSVNESKAPLGVFSVIGVVIPLDKFFFVSRAIYLLLLNSIIVKPLFK